jgi:REP element-mobilizing transposase RayT
VSTGSKRIAEEYDLTINTMEVVEDHVYIFLEAPPRLSPARIVQMEDPRLGHGLRPLRLARSHLCN